jgi:hypothetical protein
MVLKFLRKYTGERMSWRDYLDLLDMARMRIWGMLYK